MFNWKVVYIYLFLKLVINEQIICQVIQDDIDPCDEKFDLVSDHTDKECAPGHFFKKVGNSIHNCFSTCVPFDLEQPCSDVNQCPPGYLCSTPGTNVKCTVDQKSCFKEYLDPSNPWRDAWKPTCLPDGSWTAKQCKGEANNGRCFCYDTSGNRIHGQAFIEKSENMTCACSRAKEQIKNQASVLLTIHCDSMGNYEPLQCNNGQCWCVESQTGKTISKIVPDSMMTVLPCYSKNDTGRNYMRPCESQEYAQKKILHEFSLHGTHHTNFPHIMCDGEGNYGYYQIVGARWFCSSTAPPDQPPLIRGTIGFMCATKNALFCFPSLLFGGDKAWTDLFSFE